MLFFGLFFGLFSGLLFLFVTPIHSSFASASPQSFTFEGLLLESDGVTPMSGDVTLTLDIYDPSGACLLYEQQVGPLDLTPEKGVFSVGIGTLLDELIQSVLPEAIWIFGSRAKGTHRPTSDIDIAIKFQPNHEG